MTPSAWVIDYIKTKERFRPTAYKPTRKDVWTIAWGHTAGVKEGDTCSTAQGTAWLRDDLASTAAAINAHVTVPIRQHQFDALCSFVFNIGAASFEESTLLRKLNDNDIGGAANEFLRWDHQAGQELEGLRIRRTEERAIFSWHAPEPWPILLGSGLVS